MCVFFFSVAMGVWPMHQQLSTIFRLINLEQLNSHSDCFLPNWDCEKLSNRIINEINLVYGALQMISLKINSFFSSSVLINFIRCKLITTYFIGIETMSYFLMCVRIRYMKFHLTDSQLYTLYNLECISNLSVTYMWNIFICNKLMTKRKASKSEWTNKINKKFEWIEASKNSNSSYFPIHSLVSVKKIEYTRKSYLYCAKSSEKL